MGDSATERIAEDTRRDELARQERIRQGTASINSQFDSTFTPGFFTDRRAKFVAYAEPQLEKQYGNAQKELTYSLARNGLLDSSVRADQTGELVRQYDIQKQQVASQAIDEETKARNAVEGARGDLLLQLQATADANGAAQGAINRSAALTQESAYQPIGDLFGTFVDTLGKQAALERAAAFGAPVTPRFRTGLFTPSAGAMKVT